MEHSISITELLKRVQIRSDKSFEWENKMTDEELDQFESEVVQMCIDEGAEDTSVCYTAKIIDREILYNVFKLDDNDGVEMGGKNNNKI